MADEPRGNPRKGMPVPGEPDAVKVARPVRRGESGNGPRGTAPGSYPTGRPARRAEPARERLPARPTVLLPLRTALLNSSTVKS
jgi:hypothetical protein